MSISTESGRCLPWSASSTGVSLRFNSPGECRTARIVTRGTRPPYVRSQRRFSHRRRLIVPDSFRDISALIHQGPRKVERISRLTCGRRSVTGGMGISQQLSSRWHFRSAAQQTTSGSPMFRENFDRGGYAYFCQYQVSRGPEPIESETRLEVSVSRDHLCELAVSIPNLAAIPSRCTLPVAPFGIESTNNILSGTLNLASRSRTNPRSSVSQGWPCSTTTA